MHTVEANSLLKSMVGSMLLRFGRRLAAFAVFQAVGTGLVRIKRLIRLYKYKFPEAEAEES